MKWNICCAGHSFDWTSVGDGQVTAVNSAYELCERADYWCCVDEPNRHHSSSLESARERQPTVLTWREHGMAWHRCGLQAVEEGTWKDRFPELGWIWEEELTDRPLSIVYAISHAISEGATEIVLHGVDMEGVGYKNLQYRKPETYNFSLEDDGPDQMVRIKLVDTQEAWHDRWEVERGLMAELAVDAEARGIIFLIGSA